MEYVQARKTSLNSFLLQLCPFLNLKFLVKFILFFLPFPERHILDSFKLKEFADDNFKFNENGEKLSKRVENTAGKGEIARNEQFLLFPQCFQKTCTADTYKPGLVWERVNAPNFLNSNVTRNHIFNSLPHNPDS